MRMNCMSSADHSSICFGRRTCGPTLVSHCDADQIPDLFHCRILQVLILCHQRLNFICADKLSNHAGVEADIQMLSQMHSQILPAQMRCGCHEDYP